MTKLGMSLAATAAAVAFLATATAAAAMEYNKADALSVAQGKPKRTKCDVTEEIDGRTYCFGDETSAAEFMKDSKANIAKADDYWQPCKGGISDYMYCD